jgi:hypothetical protein
MNLVNLGKILIITGVIIAVAGGIIILLSRSGLIGRIPGDIVIRRENFTLYFPIATSIIISIVLSVILTIIFRILSK